MGKAVWPGAVAALSNRDAVQVDASLGELSRLEFLRPVFPSSMAREHEFGFWHALVRDVAYGELPRAVRMAKHRAAAGWIIQLAGGALSEDAEIVADHFTEALALAGELGEEGELLALRSGLVESLLSAAVHAMGTDVPRAEAHLRRILDLLEDGDPRRPDVLGRLGRALIATSDYPEAATILQEAVDAHALAGEASGDYLLVPLCIALVNSGDAPAASAVVEWALAGAGDEPSPFLVDVLGERAMIALLAARDEHALALAQDALTRAAALGIPEPHRALAARGLTLLAMGEPSGEDDLRRAIDGAIREGDLRAAAVAYHNLAASLAEARGPAAGLAAFDEAIGFAASRGLPTELHRSGRLETLMPLGRWDEVVREAEEVGAWAAAHGDEWGLLLADEFDMQVRLARGEKVARRDDLPSRAVLLGTSPSDSATVAADAASAEGDMAAARGLLEEGLEETPPGGVYDIARFVRSCLGARAPDLARQAFDSGTPPSPWNAAKVRAAQAMLTEEAGDSAAARDAYADAARAFRELGDVHEEAHALLGSGRTRLHLGDAGAAADLRAAGDIFKALGAAGRLEEIRRLLGSAP